jgi:hypothetical protein
MITETGTAKWISCVFITNKNSSLGGTLSPLKICGSSAGDLIDIEQPPLQHKNIEVY